MSVRRTNPRRRFVRATGAAIASLGFPAFAAAHAGARPIRFILPVAAGSGVDAILRAAEPALARAFGAPVVIENQPGAGGIVGTQALVRSAPDGTTLSVVSNNHVIYPSVYKSLPFDPIADITPVAVIGTSPMVLVANPKVPAKDAKELAALLKAKPGQLNYASSGNGTILHLAGAMFLDQSGTDAKHIPYKGVGPMLSDLIGGQVEFGVSSLPSVQPHIRSGALRAIGIASPARSPAAPDIPTFAEQGLPDFVVEGWFAVVGPADLPPAEVARVHDAFAAAFASPEVREAMAKQGNTIDVSTPDRAAQHFRSELAKYAVLVRKARVQVQ